MKTLAPCQFVKFALILTCAGFAFAVQAQQASKAQPAEGSALSPPINHESGTIDEVLTAEDGAYRMRGYIVSWRSARVFVSGPPAEPRQTGTGVDLTVYRSNVNGQRSLRFAIAKTADDTTVAQEEVRNSQVAISAGTAKVEEVLNAENEGYRFTAYLVTWHGRHVAVVDPLLHAPHAVGDQIEFRVFHTGADENQRLSFSLSD
jgi:hypothetical protein